MCACILIHSPATATCTELPLLTCCHLPTGKHWCWVFWKFEVQTVEFARASEVLVRAWDSSMNTQPSHLTWNLMGMMNNCHFRIKIHTHVDQQVREPLLMICSELTTAGVSILDHDDRVYLTVLYWHSTSTSICIMACWRPRPGRLFISTMYMYSWLFSG